MKKLTTTMFAALFAVALSIPALAQAPGQGSTAGKGSATTSTTSKTKKSNTKKANTKKNTTKKTTDSKTAGSGSDKK